VVEDLDLKAYTNKPWYVQQQAVTEYTPLEQNFCTKAEYSIKKNKSFLGYEIDVNNSAQDANGNNFGGKLCAAIDSPGKLRVAPCLVPPIFAGPYWVVAYDEAEGYALVSGGQPTIPSDKGDGCRTGDGINNSGLWIFTRSQARDDKLVEKVREIALNEGFDLEVLNDVVQEGCGSDAEADESDSCGDDEGSFRVWFGSQRDCDWVEQLSVIRCMSYSEQCKDTCGKCQIGS
jgi:lipocalin